MFKLFFAIDEMLSNPFKFSDSHKPWLWTENLSPSENECCSICTTYGDLNSDSALNVSDVVLIINLILTNQYSAIADINSDNTLNVTDVVLIINTIIS